MHFNHNYHFFLDRILHDKFTKLYFFQASIVFAKSLLGIFVPVYMFKLGYSLNEIFFYVFLSSIFYFLAMPLSVNLIRKIGFKYSLLLSVPLYIFHVVTLNYLPLHTKLVYYLSSLSFGLYVSIFWPAMHSELAANGSNKKIGKQMSILNIVTTLVATFAPFIGGYFLDNFSFYILVLVVLSLVFLGSIPLIFSEDVKLMSYSLSYKRYFKLFIDYLKTTDKYAFISEGIEASISVLVWPIFLFILFNKSYTKLGTLFTFVSLFSVLIMMYFKDHLDKSDRTNTLKRVTYLLSLNWFLRSLILIFGFFLVYFVESFFKLVQNLFHVSYFSIFYNNAKKKNFLDYIIVREQYVQLSKCLFILLVLFPLFKYFGDSKIVFLYAVFFGFLASFGFLTYKEIRT
jgi:MFS family permease